MSDRQTSLHVYRNVLGFFYLVQTAQVRYLPSSYGGQANDPHTAKTGYNNFPSWSSCPAVKASGCSFKHMYWVAAL